MNATNIKPDASLKEELQLTRQLVELLKQEQEQLIGANVEGLITVTEEKSRVVARMAELTNRRYRALAAAGFDAMEGGMRAWLNAATDTEAEQSWQELLREAQSVKSLNNTNGVLISKQMTYNQKALNIWQGGQTSNLYGPNGQATSKMRPRGFVVG